MNRSTLLVTRLFRRHKWMALTAGMIAAGAWSPVSACEYCDQGDGGIVCDSGCDSCCDSGCDSCGSSGPCPLVKALDRFAGGVEKFLGFDKCGSSCGSSCGSGCDCACDAGIMSDVMVPIEHSRPAPKAHTRAIPTVPPESYSPAPYAEPTVEPAQPYTQPAPVAPQPETTRPSPAPDPNASERLPQPQPLPPIRREQQDEGGSIFDTLNDPFSDDQARRVPANRYLRPTMNDKRSQAQTPKITTWKPMTQKPRFSAHAQHNHHVQSKSGSNSLKQAAGRQPTLTIAKHATHRNASAHQHSTTRRSQHVPHTHQVRHTHRAQPTHQTQQADRAPLKDPAPTRQVRHTHQVKLSAAPKPQTLRRTLRSPRGQRHTVAAPQGYGHTTARQSPSYQR